MCCMATHAPGTQIEAHGIECEVFARAYSLLCHFFPSFLCTIALPMYTAGAVVPAIPWHSCSSHGVAEIQSFGVRLSMCFTVKKGKGTHPPAARGCSWPCARTDRKVRGKALLVLRHGGGGYVYKCARLSLCPVPSFAHAATQSIVGAAVALMEAANVTLSPAPPPPPPGLCAKAAS